MLQGCCQDDPVPTKSETDRLSSDPFEEETILSTHSNATKWTSGDDSPHSNLHHKAEVDWPVSDMFDLGTPSGGTPTILTTRHAEALQGGPSAERCCDLAVPVTADTFLTKDRDALRPGGGYAGKKELTFSEDPRLHCYAGDSDQDRGPTSSLALSERKSWNSIRPPPLTTSPFEIDPELLRGVELGKVISRGGALWKPPSPDAAVDLSEEVDALDSFISHAWVSPTFWKVLTLLIHFYLPLAAFLTLVALLVLVPLVAVADLPSVVCSPVKLQQIDFEGELCITPACSVLLPGVALLSLLLAPSMPAGMKPRKMVFLDSQCINQTDREMTARGVYSLRWVPETFPRVAGLVEPTLL